MHPQYANALARLTPACGPPPRISQGLAAVRARCAPVLKRPQNPPKTLFFKNCESRPTEGACKLCALRAHANLLGALSALCTCMCPQCPLYLQGLHGCPQCPLYLQGLHGCPQCPRLRHRLRHSPTDPMTPPCVTPWTFLVSRMVGK